MATPPPPGPRSPSRLRGFLVGGVALMLDPVNMTLFWIGCALGVGSLVVFGVMAKLGLHGGHD